MVQKLLSSLAGAVIFYTAIPLPRFVPIDFQGIAIWLPWIGFLLASLLGLAGWIFQSIGFSPLLSAILITGLGVYLTGGLHLDGAMDSGDGLAVQGDKAQKLDVMRDSRTGAFGVMVAIFILALKWGGLSSMWIGLLLAMSWSRWGQLMAIALYDYLRQEGKGAFLQKNLRLPTDVFTSSLFVIPLILGQHFYWHHSWFLIMTMNMIAVAIAFFTGWWFNYQLEGHTGDTYGATVEWSEALILCILSLFI